jgi:hypothetical protein
MIKPTPVRFLTCPSCSFRIRTDSHYNQYREVQETLKEANENEKFERIYKQIITELKIEKTVLRRYY